VIPAQGHSAGAQLARSLPRPTTEMARTARSGLSPKGPISSRTGPHGGAVSSGSPVDEKRRDHRVEQRRRTGDLPGNSKRVGITVNAGRCRGGGKEGGTVALFNGEARLAVTDGLTDTLQLRGMNARVRAAPIREGTQQAQLPT
jgi:hypothetical protein